MSCSLLYANIKIISLCQIINQMRITDSNRVRLQEDHVSKRVGDGDCAGKICQVTLLPIVVFLQVKKVYLKLALALCCWDT